MCICVCSHMLWMSENNSRNWLAVTSSHHTGPRNQAEVVSTEPSHWSANPPSKLIYNQRSWATDVMNIKKLDLNTTPQSSHSKEQMGQTSIMTKLAHFLCEPNNHIISHLLNFPVSIVNTSGTQNKQLPTHHKHQNQRLHSQASESYGCNRRLSKTQWPSDEKDFFSVWGSSPVV